VVEYGGYVLVDVFMYWCWIYSELDVEVDEFALGLLDCGIDKGDWVGIWVLNCVEWVLL